MFKNDKTICSFGRNFVVASLLLLVTLSSFGFAATQLNFTAGALDIAYAVNGDWAIFTNSTGTSFTNLSYIDSDGNVVSTQCLATNRVLNSISVAKSAVNNKYYYLCGAGGSASGIEISTFDIATKAFGVPINSTVLAGTATSLQYNGTGGVMFDSQQKFFVTARIPKTESSYLFVARVNTNGDTMLCGKQNVTAWADAYSFNPWSNIAFNTTHSIAVIFNSTKNRLTILDSLNNSNCSIFEEQIITRNMYDGAGTESGFRLFFSSSNHSYYNAYALFSTNADGNEEIYLTNASQGSTATRLTVTAGQETLQSAYQNAYGTVYLVYTDQYSNVFMDSFCGYDAPSITFGTKCAGESGGFSGGQQQPWINYKLVATDKSRCDWFSTACWKNDLTPGSTPEDWLELSYTVNDSVVTTGTCTAIDDTTLAAYNFVYNDPNNPFQTVGVYSANVRASLGDSLSIRCVNGTTPIIAAFHVQGTWFPLQNWDLKAGKQTHYDDKISVYEQPAVARVYDTVSNKFGIANVAPETTCTYVNSALSQYGSSSGYYTQTNTEDLGNGYLKSTILLTGDPLAIQGEAYTAGYQKYEVACVGTESVDAQLTSPISSVTEVRSLQVVDNCNGNYLSSRIINLAAPISNYYNDTFFYQQYPNYQLDYQYLKNGTSDWVDAACRGNWTLTYSNGTLISQYLITGGVIPQMRLSLGGNDSDKYLPVGSYYLTVSCSNTNPNLCIENRQINKTVTIITGAACDGTPTDCGTITCNVCSSAPITCESGLNATLPPMCIDQICVNQSVLGNENFVYGYPQGCITYAANVEIDTPGNRYVDIPCTINKDLRWFITITNNGQLVNPASIDALCEYKIKTGVQSAFSTTVYRDNAQLDLTNKRFIATLPNYASFLGCSTDWEFEAQCYSDKFLTKKIGSQTFNIVANAFCNYNGVSIPSGSCASEYTKTLLDNPLYCSRDLKMINNTAACGCPPGMIPANSSNSNEADSCMGTPQGGLMSLADIRGLLFWITSFPNWLIVIIVFLVFIKFVLHM